MASLHEEITLIAKESLASYESRAESTLQRLMECLFEKEKDLRLLLSDCIFDDTSSKGEIERVAF